ncbi:MAG: response regulator [Myxococcaceae bacterium]
MKVLIVEDARTLASLLQVYLQGWDLTFEQAPNGKQGLESARRSIPNLIISDVRMPEMDGYQFCTQVRADPRLRSVPVILYSSMTDDDTRRKALGAGASAFLVKPVGMDAIRSAVAQLLGFKT